jgi:hypothetical protein
VVYEASPKKVSRPAACGVASAPIVFVKKVQLPEQLMTRLADEPKTKQPIPCQWQQLLDGFGSPSKQSAALATLLMQPVVVRCPNVQSGVQQNIVSSTQEPLNLVSPKNKKLPVASEAENLTAAVKAKFAALKKPSNFTLLNKLWFNYKK